MTERRPPLDLSEEQLNYIVTRVNHAMLNEPRCWGPTKRVIVGQNVALANTLFNTSSGMVIIGDDSFFGHNVCLLTGTHDHHKRGVSRHESVPDSGRDILIGREPKDWDITTNATPEKYRRFLKKRFMRMSTAPWASSHNRKIRG